MATHDITPDALRDLAQYVLAASTQLRQGTLDPKATDVLGGWLQASDYLRALTNEYTDSVAAKALRRAVGFSTRRQLAQDDAAVEVQALFENSDAIRNQIADGDWEPVSEVVVREAIGAFVASLEEGQ